VDSTFLLKLALSLVVGSSWVTISTWIAEKISGKLGGLITGLPSTAVISLLFVAYTQDIDAIQDATLVVPFSAGVYTYFYLTYLVATKSNFYRGLSIALGVWLIFAILVSKMEIINFIQSIIVWIVLVCTSLFLLIRYIQIAPRASNIKVTNSPLWIKVMISSLVIFCIVLISKILGPIWGGILSTFPALATSSFLITYRSGGVEFTRLIAKNVMISTTTTIGLYAIFVRYTYPALGMIWGTITSYCLLLIVAIPLYYLLFDRLKKI